MTESDRKIVTPDDYLAHLRGKYQRRHERAALAARIGSAFLVAVGAMIVAGYGFVIYHFVSKWW